MRLLVAVAFACLSVTLFPCDAFRTNSGGRQAWPSSRSPQRGHEKKCISEPCVSPHENRGVWLAHVHEPRSMPPARLGSHFCVRSRGCGTCDRGNFMNLSLFTTRTQETRTSLALGRRSTSRVRVQSYDQIFPNRRRIPVDRANGKSNMVLEEKDANHRSESSSDNVLISEVQNGDKDETAEDERCDVVIVGAGFAGLAAANKLRKGGVTNVVILEGRDRVGGRSVTSHELGAGDVDVPVDLGSAWVQGRTDNPVQALVDRHKIPHGLAGRDDDAATVWDCGGGVVTPERMKRLLKLRKRFLGYMKKRQQSDAVDTDLQTVADDFAAANDISDDSDDRRGLRWILDAEISQEYAAPLSEMSLWWWNADEEFDGGDSYLAVPGGGYTALVDKFASPVSANVRLRCRVTGIDYGGADGVRVCYEHTDSDPQRDNRRKGATIVADHVLVTLPLGVLKAGTVEFSPTLPNSKQRAIRSLGSGLANKCALYWEGMEDSDVFWPRDKEWITRIAPVGEEQGRWTEFYNAHGMNGGMPLLVGFVTGANAARIECLSDGEVAAEALASLRCIFGEESVPEPTGCIVTRWGGDEFARGAYSFQKVGSEKSSRKKLAKPVGDRLWFAGEATHCRYPATTHGALLSGEDAARNILSEIRSE